MNYPDLHVSAQSSKPVVIIPPLQEAGWLERQRNGHLVGKVLSAFSVLTLTGAIGSGIAIIVGFWVKEVPKGKALLLAVSGALASVLSKKLSTHYLTKSYFNDPEAQKEYREWFFSHSLEEGIQRFEWDNIWKVVVPVDVSTKLRDELDGRGFHYAWSQFSRRSMTNFSQFKLLELQEFRQLFKRDVEEGRSAAGWQPCLLARFDSYADWLVQHLGIPKEEIRGLLMTDRQTLNFSFAEIVEHGGYNLFCQDLLTQEWLHHKFVEELAVKNSSFEDISRRYRPWLLDSGIVQPHELSGPFMRLLQSIDFTQIDTNYADWPMRAYLDQIVEDEYVRNKIRELQAQLRDIQKIFDNQQQSTEANRSKKISAHQVAYTRSYQAAESVRDSAVRTIDGKSPGGQRLLKEANRQFESKCAELQAQFDAQKIAVNSDADQAVASATVEYERERSKTNKEWRQFLTQNRQFQQKLEAQQRQAPVVTNVNVVVSTAPPAAPPAAPAYPPSAPPE